MRAVIIDKPGAVRVADVEEPAAGPNDVVIQVGACGICGTDIHIIDGEFPPTHYPLIPGHEFGGEVVAVGEQVDGDRRRRPGRGRPDAELRRVLLLPAGHGQPLRAVERGRRRPPPRAASPSASPCRRGRVYPLPDGMSLQAAALIEPISCVVRGFHRLQPQVGESYLIYGAGPMGLLNAQLARYNGAGLVAMIDINPSRLERARREFGFEVVGASLDEVRAHAPRGFDNVIEATGVTKVAEMAIDAVKRRGKLLLFGVCPPGEKAAYDAFKIYNEEITILGTMAVLNSYGPAIDVLTAGAVDADKMVTHTFASTSSPRRSPSSAAATG